MIPARVLFAAALTAVTLSWSSPADAAPAPAETQRAVFTGTFVTRPQVDETPGADDVRRYQVEVVEVFGPVDITTERVTVRSGLALENCGVRKQGRQGDGGKAGQGQQPSGTATPTPSPTQSPTQPAGTPIDRQLRLFEATLVDGEYEVALCTDVTLATDDVVAEIEDELGQGRPPGADQAPTPDPASSVTYLCPDDREALPENLGRAESSGTCSALEDDPALDRTAAPGLALVIVGVLGLLVARRMGRRRAGS